MQHSDIHAEYQKASLLSKSKNNNGICEHNLHVFFFTSKQSSHTIVHSVRPSTLQSNRKSTVLFSYTVSITLHILKSKLIYGYSINLCKPPPLHCLRVSHSAPDVSLPRFFRESTSRAQRVSSPTEKRCGSSYAGFHIWLQTGKDCNRYEATFEVIDLIQKYFLQLRFGKNKMQNRRKRLH